MKRFIFLILTLFAFSTAFAQTIVSGYYVTNVNDTVSAKIKIPRTAFIPEDLSKLFFKVELTDSLGGQKTFKPADIKGFDFILNGYQHTYYSKPIAEKTYRFLQSVILGEKTSVYFYQTVNQNGAPIGTFYTFEKANGTYLFLNTGMRNLGNFRDALKAFYNDNPEIQQLIDSKFQTKGSIKHDVIELARAVNNL